MKKVRWVLLGVGIVLIIVVAAAAVFIYDRLNKDVEELAQVDGDLAFISDRDGSWDIVILRKDGTLQNLTAVGEGDDYLFNFTFTSDTVYFYTNRSGTFNPARVKVDGGEVEVLNFMTAAAKAFGDQHFDVNPQWSPDGQRLAWIKTQGLSNNVCLAPATDPNDFDCLTESQGSNTELAWSPDGSALAFASDRDKNQDIWVINVASEESTRLTHDEGWAFQPAWSMDGQQILFTWNLDDSSLEDGRFDLHLVKPDGSELHRMTADEKFTGDPAYSPSGAQVAYMSNESGEWQVYVMDVDGSNVRQVTESGANYMFPAWVPSLANTAAE